MRAKHITLAAILGTIAAACFEGMAPALELGDLQAVPSSHPPYVFHLLIRGSSGDRPDWPSVTVRRPGDALCLVNNQTVELRLQHLTDVELEISAGGQLLNRLFLKGELQTAQARLTASLAWRRYQTAKATGQTHSRLAALLNEAYQAHRAWTQLDPRGAQQRFSELERERQLSLAADLGGAARPTQGSVFAQQIPPPRASQEAADAAQMEHEMRLIRDAIRGLAGQVTPWMRDSARPWQDAGQVVTPMVAALLGGLSAAGIAGLFIGCLLQRRALARQRQRRCVSAAAFALPLAPPAHSASRIAQMARPRSSTPTDLLEALGRLQHALIRLQNAPSLPTQADLPRPGPGRTGR